MGISQTTSAIMIFLTGLLPASCHKSAPQQKSAPPAVVASAGAKSSPAVKADIRNLGEIVLTNRNETSFQLATGENCTLTPKQLDRKNMQLTLSVESRNDYGETHDFSVIQVIAQSGQPLQVAVGKLNLAFTPRLTGQE